MPPKQTMAKGICQVCKRPRAVRADGKIGRHKMGGVDTTAKKRGDSGALTYLRPQCRGVGQSSLV